MIKIKIGLDGIPNPSKILLGNKYENEDEIIVFDLPDDFENFNKYIIGILFDKKTQTKRTVVLPVLNNQFIVSSQLTYFDGIWELYLMARGKTLDLSKTPVDITHDENERVFISNPIRGIVNRSSIEREEIDNLPLDSNIKIVYDDLMSLIQEVKRARNNGDFDGISPTVQIVEGDGQRTITITDRDGGHSTVVKDYEHSQEFQDLSAQVRADALASAESEKNAKASESASSLSAAKAQEQANLSKSYAEQSKASQTATAQSEKNAKGSETIIEQNKLATAQSEKNAKDSETKAKTSETNAKTSEQNARTKLEEIQTIKTQIDTQEQNVTNLETSVKQSEAKVSADLKSVEGFANNAKQSETNSSQSEKNALESSQKALQSEKNVVEIQTNVTQIQTDITNKANNFNQTTEQVKKDIDVKVRESTTNAQNAQKEADRAKQLADTFTVDTEMSDTSTNPVQNKIVKKYVDPKFSKIDGRLTGLEKSGLSLIVDHTIVEGEKIIVVTDLNDLTELFIEQFDIKSKSGKTSCQIIINDTDYVGTVVFNTDALNNYYFSYLTLLDFWQNISLSKTVDYSRYGVSGLNYQCFKKEFKTPCKKLTIRLYTGDANSGKIKVYGR